MGSQRKLKLPVFMLSPPTPTIFLKDKEAVTEWDSLHSPLCLALSSPSFLCLCLSPGFPSLDMARPTLPHQPTAISQLFSFSTSPPVRTSRGGGQLSGFGQHNETWEFQLKRPASRHHFSPPSPTPSAKSLHLHCHLF